MVPTHSYNINMLYQCTLNVCQLGNWWLFHGQILLEPRGQFYHLLAQSAPHEQRGGLLGQTSSGGNHAIYKKPNCSSELPEKSTHQAGNKNHRCVTSTGADPKLICCINCLVAAQVCHPRGDGENLRG